MKTKKKVFPKNEILFSPDSSGHLHSDVHQSQIIGGDAYVDHTQTIRGDTVKLLGDISRGGVEGTRLEAKAKNTKNIRGQGQGQPFRGQTLLRPRTGMLEAKDQGHKRKCSQKQKKTFTKIFLVITTKKRFSNNFSGAPQNFYKSKNIAVLEPRTA